MIGNRGLLAALLGGLCLGLGWRLPGSSSCALLGWVAAACLCLVVLAPRHRYRSVVAICILSHCLAFYWLFGTISKFGGLHLIPALVVFALFLLLSSFQFIGFVFVYDRLPQSLDKLSLRTAIAWVAMERLAPRIFPWMLGHMQLGLPPLAQAADLVGTQLLSFTMIWACESLIRSFTKRRFTQLWLPILATFALGFYGTTKLGSFARTTSENFQAVLVQANISLIEKHDMLQFESNVHRYVELTKQVTQSNPHSLVIWPESVLLSPIPTSVTHVSQTNRLPYFGEDLTLLLGGLTVDSNRNFYNSAIAIQADGRVLPPGHKVILMPFGEYTPFSDWFPFLKDLNPTAGGFTPGGHAALLPVELVGSDSTIHTVTIGTLICYEDVADYLAREATRNGAQVLVNLTNDAWFGDTVAPYQHHLIASFRAIENRRFLLRSTNSGLTAVVDPTGQTVGTLPPFSENTLLTHFQPSNSLSPYVNYTGNSVWWLMVLFSATSVIAHFIRRKS